MRHTSVGFESMQKYFSPPSIESAIRLRIFFAEFTCRFPSSLNWRLEIRLGISFLLSANFLKGSFHCRYFNVSAVKLKAITSISENLEPLLFACYSLLYSLNHENCLQISSILLNIAWKLCIRWFDIKSFITLIYYKSIIMCNFLLPFFYLFNPAK